MVTGQNKNPTRSETQAWYNRISLLYDLISDPWEKATRQEGVRLLEPQCGETFLDIGCGTGHGLLALAQAAGPGIQLYGLDLSTSMLSLSARRIKRHQISTAVQLIVGDATCLPFGKDTFDAIFASYTVELFNTEEIPVLLHNLQNVLRLGGRLCAVSLSNSGKSLFMRQLYTWAQRRFPKWIDCRPIHLSQALQDAGFEIQAISLRSILDLPVEIVVAVQVK